MRGMKNKLSMIFLILFIGGLIFLTYFLYNLPVLLMQDVNIVNLNNIQSFDPLFNKINVVIGLVLGTGLTCILLLMINNHLEKGEKIVYIETFRKNTEAKIENEHKEEVKHHEFNTSIPVITSLVNSQVSLQKAAEKMLSEVCKELEASQAAMYLINGESRTIETFATFAFSFAESQRISYEIGEGLAGQVAKEGKLINLDNVPQGYITILSGLGKATPSNLVIVPLIQNSEVIGVVEIASFTPFGKDEEEFLNHVLNLLNNRIIESKLETENNLKAEPLADSINN
jgi:putative methionine-R-sulfoxide reductase with GAF domain